MNSEVAGRRSHSRWVPIPLDAAVSGRGDSPADAESDPFEMSSSDASDASEESAGGASAASRDDALSASGRGGPVGARKRPRSQAAPAPSAANLGSALGLVPAGAVSAGDSLLGTTAAATTTAAAKRLATIAARSTQQRVGIGNVSVANDVRLTGGHFSAADSAPHVLRAKAPGYAAAFTSSQLPLNRPWDGPPVQGATAYRVGATGDLRVLWRQVCRRESVRTLCSTAAALTAASGASAAPASGPRSLSSGISAVVSALGGETAFREAPEFPVDHAALRDALRRAGLADLNPVDVTSLSPGGVPTGDSSRPRKGRRVPNSRAFIVKGNAHLDPEQRRAMELARLQVLRSQEERT